MQDTDTKPIPATEKIGHGNTQIEGSIENRANRWSEEVWAALRSENDRRLGRALYEACNVREIIGDVLREHFANIHTQRK